MRRRLSRKRRKRRGIDFRRFLLFYNLMQIIRRIRGMQRLLSLHATIRLVLGFFIIVVRKPRVHRSSPPSS